ncbi:hypothetical protein SLE2022_142690 [Rubroshorea leprosula]
MYLSRTRKRRWISSDFLKLDQDNMVSNVYPLRHLEVNLFVGKEVQVVGRVGERDKLDSFPVKGLSGILTLSTTYTTLFNCEGNKV